MLIWMLDMIRGAMLPQKRRQHGAKLARFRRILSRLDSDPDSAREQTTQFSHWKLSRLVLHLERLTCAFGLSNGEFMRKLSEKLTPQQRMARMRKSFEKGKSVLTVDYKYFTTPDTTPKLHAPIRRNKVAHKSAGQFGPKSPKRS
jgi:hypothetical protein